MWSEHLSTGSEQPALEKGKLRLYSMEFCPYAQRVRLVLLAKGVPHDIVNVNLINKPDWIFKLHPEGKVPILETATKELIVESLDISDYLDVRYPNPPLYPTDPDDKQRHKNLIKDMDFLIRPFFKITLGIEKKTVDEWLNEFKPYLNKFEEVLNDGGENEFLSGATPGMVDFMLWPWAERVGIISLVLGEKLLTQNEAYPRLKAWRKAMQKNPIVAQTYHTVEQFYKVLKFKTEGATPDYDTV